MAKKQSFAKVFEELEAVAAYFEREDVDVEEGIKKFEEGMELAALCKERLAEIENKVVEIRKKFEAPVDEERSDADGPATLL